MKPAIPILILLTACAAETDPMPYLNSTQRACLTQVKTAVRLQDGEQAMLFGNREGRFAGAVTKNGFTGHEPDSTAFDGWFAQATKQQERTGRSEVAPAVFLDAADKALWDTLTPAQRERALTFLANGGTIQSSLGEN